jgi:adsorption protein B
MHSIYFDIVRFFQVSHDLLYVFTFVVAAFLLLSGLDDLIVDLYYWFLYLFRRTQLLQFQRLDLSGLTERPEKAIAIFIPAWHEESVIELMLLRACQQIRYKNYDIFVGVYPNDPGTMERVRAVARIYPHVHAVVASHPGPSTKAQNLNDMHQGMRRWENQTGIRYDIVVLHDAEDLIHPLSLRVYNYFIPEYDMVQIPIYPLGSPHKRVVHWTYADEFAENHTKDLMARQVFSPFIPSAGVGTAYHRYLIEFVGTSYARNMFSKKSLTEDYDIALRLALGQAKLLYLNRPFGLNVSTWAYFPQTFSAAVRQRARWLIGICLQAWRNYGWHGSFRLQLTLYRDRKAVIANIVNALAYIVLVYVLLYELADWGLRSYGSLPPLVERETTLWYIVLADTGLMLWRFVHRFLSVSRVYGRTPAFLSIPRLPVSNIINFAATVRALHQFFRATRKQEPIRWDKTDHEFPTATEAMTR